MNQRLVTIAVYSLALLFALACVAFAWRASTMPGAAPPAEPAAAQALWQARCGGCHAPAEFLPRLAGPGREAAAADLVQRLARHGDATFAEDLQLIQWLAGQAATGAPAEEAPAEDDDYTL